MPLKTAIWKVDKQPTPLKLSELKDERLLEDMIENLPAILEEQWLIIGRQVITSSGKRIDLLAIAPDSSLVIIELKRSKTDREVVAQALDYATWVEELKSEDIAAIYFKYSGGKSLVNTFKERFRTPLQEENLNQSHQMIVVASELDSRTERIIKYLSDRGVAINAVFFEVFASDSEQFLVRRWFVDPAEVQSAQTSSNEAKEPWNGEFFVSFGDDEQRSWEDARKYGFISAGGGSWYSRTLNLLTPGKRIWVRIPGKGYVGVGIVDGEPTPASEFRVSESGKEISILNIESEAKYENRVGTEDQEYFVKVEWIETVGIEDAYDELGFFGNQNSVCRPTASGWVNTIAKLKKRFKVD
jgi:Endonuclease NucS